MTVVPPLQEAACTWDRVHLLPYERRLLAWSPGLVLLSSVAGLNRWVALFPSIWAANFWGDLVFTLGTVATYVIALRMGRGTSAWMSALVAVVLTGLVYDASFALTESGWDDEASFWELDISSVGTTIGIGWPGLIVNGAVAAALTPWARGDPTRATAR